MKSIIINTIAFSLFAVVCGRAADVFDQIRAATAAGDLERASLLFDAEKKRVDSLTATESRELTELVAEGKTNWEGGTAFARWSAAGFRLQKGPGVIADDVKPASFSFENDLKGSDTTWGANFFLGWSPNRDEPHHFGYGELSYEASVQGSLSSATDDAADAWRLRIGGELDLTHPALLQDPILREPFVNHLYTTFALLHESDRDFETRRLSFEMLTTPNTRFGGIGESIRFGEAASFRWRPYFGLDVGELLDSREGMDVPEDTFRLMATGSATLSLHFLEEIVGVEGFNLFADNTLRHLTESGATHNFLRTGASLLLNENVGIEFAYTLGEDAPNFVDVETFSISLAIKF